MPLQITPRGGNIPIKTITVSTSNAGSLDASSLHRSLAGNAANLQATTIMPIAKIVSQQQQNLASVQGGNQSTPVYIHTRIPAPSSTAASTQASQVVTVSTPSSTQSGFSSNSTTVYYEPASVSIAPSLVASSEQTKTTASSSIPNSESYTVVSGPNVRYSEKMIHSIIASSFQQQQQNANNANQAASSVSNQNPTVRYSPLVESQSQSGSIQNQPQSHQIITMTSGAIIQQVIYINRINY